MISLIVFLLAAYGLTNAITGGQIFEPLRESLARIPRVGDWLFGFIECPMCVGFWVGLGIYTAGLRPNIGATWWVSGGCLALAASGWCWIVRVALARLGEDRL
jgi:hypothetical protein